MDKNQIMQQIANSLDKQLLDFEYCQNFSYDNKLVDTLRKSNQVEILNIKTKYKQIFNTTIQTFINLIQNETAQQQSNILMKNLEHIQLIESQKNKINEYQLMIQELNDDNIQLRTQLQLRNENQSNLNLILHYEKMLNDLQQELDEKNNQIFTKDTQILQEEQLIQTLKVIIHNLEQQINQFNTQTQQKQIQIEYKQQSKILKEQATQFDNIEEINQNQYDKLVQIQNQIKQKTFNNESQNNSQNNSQNKSQNRSQSISLSVTGQFQQKVQDYDIQSSQFIDNEFKKCQTQNLMNNSTLSNNLKLQKIKIRRKYNLNDLYLYSKSQRTSRVDVDQYYEPSLLYRYNVLESIKK